MQIYTRWFPQKLIGRFSRLYRGKFWNHSHEMVLEVATDSELLMNYFRMYQQEAEPTASPRGKLCYLLEDKRTQDWNRPPESYYETLVNRKRFAIGGICHYGHFKSMAAGIGSFLMSSSKRQGIHSAGFSLGDRGILLLGGASSGKTTLLLQLMPYLESIISDDWCDVIVRDAELAAVSEENNMSLNLNDLPELIRTGKIPPAFAKLPTIPHGWRDKIVFPLQDLCGQKKRSGIKIHDICILGNFPVPQILESVSERELYWYISSVSGHCPFCYPTVEILKNVLRDIPDPESKKIVLKAVRNRLAFCSRVKDWLADQRGRIILLPNYQTSHDPTLNFTFLMEKTHV